MGKSDLGISAVGPHQRCRMDFEQELLRADDETHVAHFVIRPHSRRYIEVTHEGVPHYLDKFLNTLIPRSEVEKSIASQMAGMPVYTLAPSVESMPTYADARRSALAHELKGNEYVPPSEKADAHKALSPDTEPRFLVFLSVDICGSTMSKKTHGENFDRALEFFLRETATLVGQFHGTVLKFTGDGFIAYIDHPSFTRQADNAVDLGVSLLVLLRESLNPELSAAGLPEIHMRVGADIGNATVKRLEVPLTGFASDEVSSDALNHAVKIQEKAGIDQFLIGRSLYELLHVDWLERSIATTDEATAPIERLYSVS